MRKAAPQCISGRTSYLRVRLAFHLYPQLIRKLFHVHRFGPPPPVTEASPWPWVAHSVSGLLPPTFAPYSDSLSLRLRHASALTLTAGEKQLAGSFFNRHAITLAGFDGLEAHGFRSISLPSRGAFRLSLTVLVHYRSFGVFSLGGWSPQLPTRFFVPRGTQVHARLWPAFAYGTLTRYGGPFQAPSASRPAITVRRLQSSPGITYNPVWT